MSDNKRKSGRRKEQYPDEAQNEKIKPSKDEYAVATFLKKNLRTKKTKCLNHNVEYFTSSKALDALMKSKFSEGENSLFSSREQAIEFMDIMLEHKFFHRAKKVAFFADDLKNKSKKNECGDCNTEKEKEKDDKTNNKKVDKIIDTEMSNTEGKIEDGTITQQEKRKRKIRLDMHSDQVFVDGSEAYVWLYDPVPIHYWIFGTLIVLGAIIICMFPLWPPILRKGVYYLSIAAAGVLVFILILTFVRFIIFVLLWLLTAGKLSFWIFPNLTQDVGFFASFWPLYEYEYRDGSKSNKSNKKSKKKKKDKYSDAEDDNGDKIRLLSSKQDESLDNPMNKSIDNVIETNIEDTQIYENKSEKESINQSESESESSGSRSSGSKDFEIVDPKDVDTPS